MPGSGGIRCGLSQPRCCSQGSCPVAVHVHRMVSGGVSSSARDRPRSASGGSASFLYSGSEFESLELALETAALHGRWARLARM